MWREKNRMEVELREEEFAKGCDAVQSKWERHFWGEGQIFFGT